MHRDLCRHSAAAGGGERSRKRRLATLCGVALGIGVAAGGASVPPPGLNGEAAGDLPSVAAPAIALTEISAGQRGYGLSVFSGDTPERFDVEVVGVMQNVRPGTSYILARLSGKGLETSGVIGGMSGSPVYIDGRLAGAVAFSWPFVNDAIAGITPIAAMRELGGHPPAAPAAPAAAVVVPAHDATDGTPAALLRQALLAPPTALPDLDALQAPQASAELGRLRDLLRGRLPAAIAEASLGRELAVLVPQMAPGTANGIQWSTSGFGPRSRALLESALGVVVPAGAGAASGVLDPGAVAVPLAPGSAVAAVLIDGDFKFAATGTVTDRQGDQVLAFGHPFLGLGPVSVPMAAAEIVTVISSQASSFKLSNLGPAVGAFEQDRQAGVQGRIGVEAPTVPLTIRIEGPAPATYRLRLANLPQLTPTLLALGSFAALDAASYAGGAQEIELDARLELAGEGELAFRQVFDGDAASVQVVTYLMAVSGFLLQNRLAEVELSAVEVTLRQNGPPRAAALVAGHAERSRVRPGERVGISLDLVAYRGDPYRHSLSIQVPEDLPDGRYSVLVGDGVTADAVRMLLQPVPPVRFRQALDLLRSFHSRRELVVLGVFADSGVAVAGEVLPRLPGSLQSLWRAAGSRSAQAAPLAVGELGREPMAIPLDGLVRIDLEVERRHALQAQEAPAAGAEPTADDAAASAPESATKAAPAPTAGASKQGGGDPR